MTGFYAKRNNEWKGGIDCSLNKFRSCLKSPDKSKLVTNEIFLSLTNMERICLQTERKQLGLCPISQKLATFLILIPRLPPKSFLAPDPRHKCPCAFCHSTLLPEQAQNQTQGPDEIWTQNILEWEFMLE